MRHLFALSALFLSTTAFAENPPVPANIPDTPAGHFITVFLNAYNSADPKQLEHYNALYNRKSPPQTWLDMHDMTGRITPMRAVSKGPNEITVLLAAEKGDGFWQEKASIDPTDPMKVVDAGLGQTDRPPEF